MKMSLVFMFSLVKVEKEIFLLLGWKKSNVFTLAFFQEAIRKSILFRGSGFQCAGDVLCKHTDGFSCNLPLGVSGVVSLKSVLRSTGKAFCWSMAPTVMQGINNWVFKMSSQPGRLQEGTVHTVGPTSRHFYAEWNLTPEPLPFWPVGGWIAEVRSQLACADLWGDLMWET